MDIPKELPDRLLQWYDDAKRPLPWREDREPYHVWLSEIMLQQTRVEAVKGYYARFLAALPTVEALAACDDETLFKLWEGLGYYSRARNLKKAAQIIVSQYGGRFPGTYGEILALPGVGPYTAGAICSICYDAPTPAVDGNVLRVVSRILADSTPINTPAFQIEAREALEKIYPAEAGNFTQALMELGATVCGPNRPPECERCPILELCQAGKGHCGQNFPVKSPKKPKKAEEITVFLLSCRDLWAIEKRENRGLLAGMWQFPNCPGTLSAPEALKKIEEMGLKPRNISREISRKHIFTHIRWEMRGIFVEVAEPGGNLTWRTLEEIRETAALPTAFRQFLEEIDYV